MDASQLLEELQFKMVKSSGAGGQHVNKVATKVVLSFNVKNSNGLTPKEKLLLSSKLGSRLTTSGELQLQCSDTRSQLRNKRAVIQRFIALIQESLKVEAPRRPTKVPRSVVKKRLENKKKHSKKKENRKPPDL